MSEEKYIVLDADILRKTTKKDEAQSGIMRSTGAHETPDFVLERRTYKEAQAEAGIQRETVGRVETDADIRRITYTGVSYKTDPSVKVTSDLAKTINSNLPHLATTEYVEDQIKKSLSDSKEMQEVLASIKDTMADDNVDRILSAMGKYLPLSGGTVRGDLEVLGMVRGKVASADKATFTEYANRADRANLADTATVATTAQECAGNALTADKASYASRAAVSDSCTGNAATATIAETAKSVESVPWSSVQDAPKKYPANGGDADTAKIAESVDWRGVRNAPDFLTEVKWSDIRGVPPTAEATTIAWENVTGRPTAMRADGGVADKAKSVDWADVQNKPAERIITWDDVTQKPSIYLKADKIDWNLDVINKPKYFPTKSVTWEQVTGKPDLFPNQPVSYKDLLNVPDKFPTTWEQIAGKPVDLVHASDKIAMAAHADKADLAVSVPTTDLGGNIWIEF